MAVDQVAVPTPHCPHCNAELPAIGLYNWMHDAWVILCVYCTDCKKTLHMQVVPNITPGDAVIDA